MVASSRLTYSLRLPSCEARTARATVKLLQIRTAVLMVPAIRAQASAAGGKFRKVRAAINQITAEHAAKEHDFRAQKPPHAERGGIALLHHIGEVMPQFGAVFVFNASGLSPVDRLYRSRVTSSGIGIVSYS